MENQTSAMEFHILPFYIKSRFISVLFAIFFFIYFLSVFTNSLLIKLIYTSDHLHTPMYLFICNLAIVDISHNTVIIPKLLYILISRNNKVSYRECFVQMYFYFLNAGAEDILLLSMAIDRYVAICNPLHYHRILNKKNCTFLVFGIWIAGSLNSFAITFQASKMTFCHSKTIHHFFCDGKALLNIACAGVKTFYAVVYIDIVIFGFGPLSCTLISYIKIMKVILLIKSKEGRRKAFSTCSSHLIVIGIYYTAAITIYVMPHYSDVLEQICSLFNTSVVPLINPLIYSFRNNEIKMVLKKLLLVEGKLRSTKPAK